MIHVLLLLPLPLSEGLNTMTTNICGVSFDVEKTLIVYNVPGDDANYEAALNAYNAALGKDEAKVTVSPSWAGDSAKRKKAFNGAWYAAEAEARRERETPETSALWDAGLVAAWGGPDPLVADRFFTRVCQLFFETSDPLPEGYISFLVHDYYVSTRVYTLPKGAELLYRIRELYPSLPMFVVSNTDRRVVSCTHLFKVYRDLLPESVFFTASDLPEVKPSPVGIFKAIEASGRTIADAACWLHVGDDQHADGGAAAAAGCLFLKCDPRRGFDAEQLMAILDSHPLGGSQREIDAVCAKND